MVDTIMSFTIDLPLKLAQLAQFGLWFGCLMIADLFGFGFDTDTISYQGQVGVRLTSRAIVKHTLYTVATAHLSPKGDAACVLAVPSTPIISKRPRLMTSPINH